MVIGVYGKISSIKYQLPSTSDDATTSAEVYIVTIFVLVTISSSPLLAPMLLIPLIEIHLSSNAMVYCLIGIL
jgi:hypothetical protein